MWFSVDVVKPRLIEIKGSRVPDIDKVRLARTGSTAAPDTSLGINDNGTRITLLGELRRTQELPTPSMFAKYRLATPAVQRT